MTAETHPPAIMIYTSLDTPVAMALAVHFKIFHAILAALLVWRAAIRRLRLAFCTDWAVCCTARPVFFVFFIVLAGFAFLPMNGCLPLCRSGVTCSLFRVCKAASGGSSSRCCFCKYTFFATYCIARLVRCSTAQTVRCPLSSTRAWAS